MMACLLFAALAFVVVGMAGATRSDAQGAADAAALAAARETRDNVLVGRDLLTLTPDQWREILGGEGFDDGEACAEAQAFAASNDASVSECDSDIPEFTVTVATNGTVGQSVIPGTEDMQGQATATALIEPRCSLQSLPTPTPSPTPSPGGGTVPDPIGIECTGGGVITVDPSNPGSLSELARKLFSVRLAD